MQTKVAVRADQIAALTLQWHRGTNSVPLEGFQRWALTGLKAALHFDHALWGMGAGLEEDGSAFINSIHLYRLPAHIMVEYEQVRHADPLAEQAVQAPDTVVSVCLGDAPWLAPKYDTLRAYAQRHGLMNTLCIGSTNRLTGSTQFITVARADVNDRFTPVEAASFGMLAPHMMQAFCTRRALEVASTLGRQGKPVAMWATAIVDATGLIHDQDAEFARMLRLEWPQWEGLCLPRAIAPLPPGIAKTYTGTQVVGELTPVNDFFLLAMRARSDIDALSARERHVARLYADGSNYKDIAETLTLSPSTVRAHVRNVFAKLSVNNKAQLAQLMG